MSGRPRKAAGAKTTAATASEERADLEPLGLAPGEVTVHRHLALLEASEPAELTALLADPRLAPLITARLGPTAAVTTPEAAQELHLALKRAGVSVTVVGDLGG